LKSPFLIKRKKLKIMEHWHWACDVYPCKEGEFPQITVMDVGLWTNPVQGRVEMNSKITKAFCLQGENGI
jgi:hypothetical protein